MYRRLRKQTGQTVSSILGNWKGHLDPSLRLRLRFLAGRESACLLLYTHTQLTATAQVCIAVVSCFLSSGIIYGFAALKPVLVKEEVYKCSTEDTVCYTQELRYVSALGVMSTAKQNRLNLIFAIASAALSVSTLPVGAILTTYGPGVGNMIGSLSLALGALLLSFGASLSFDAYIPGFLLLGVGGPFIFASALHLANAFPTHSTLILSALTGAFDSSNALFLVFRAVNEKTGFSIRALFLAYLVVPLFIVVMQLSVMPRTLYRTPEELVLQAEVYAERYGPAGQRCNDGTDDRTIIQKTQTLLNDTGDLSRNKPALSKSNQAPDPIPYINPHQLLPSLRESSLNSPRFVLLGLFTALQILRLNYFIASITRQSEFLSSAKARTLTSLFDILLSLGGITASLFTRPLLQRTTTQYIFLALVTGATLTGAINCIPTVPAGYIHILAYVLYRPIFLTAIPESVGRIVPGFRCSRRIGYSVLISLAGLSNLVIPGLDALSFSVSRGDFLPVNAALTVASFVVGALLCGFPGKPEQGDTTRPAVEEGGLPGATGEAADGSGGNERDVERDREQEPLLQRRVDTRESYGGIT